MDHQTFLDTRYFSALNGLRAISVIAVVWHHTAGHGYPGGQFLAHGYLGVDFFFAISGFLITTLLLRERRSRQRVSLRHFYLRRSLRIFPLYYAVLGLYVLLTAATRASTPEGQAFFDHLPSFMTYTSNWFVNLTTDTSVTFYFAWSLATEEQFYLLWPPILAGLLAWGRSKVLYPVAALVGLAWVTLFANHVVGTSAFGWRVVGSISLPILVGSLGAVLLDDERAFRRIAPVLGATATAPALFAALLALVAVDANHELIQLTMALVVLACCVRENRVLTPLLTLRSLVWIGVVSYGVYLMHMLAANAVRPIVGESGTWTFLATLGLAVAMATVSFKVFETPILRFKDRFTAPRAEGHLTPP